MQQRGRADLAGGATVGIGDEIDHVKRVLERPLEPTSVETSVGNESGSDSQPASRKSRSLSPVVLKLGASRLESTTAHKRETDGVSEIWEENGSGLSWGHKVAHDHTWEERWLQQETRRRIPGAVPGDFDTEVVAFGRSNGINGRLHQRWTAGWETCEIDESSPLVPPSAKVDESPTDKEVCKAKAGFDNASHSSEICLKQGNSAETAVTNFEAKGRKKKQVKKSVRQYEEDMTTVKEEWNEEILEELRPRIEDGSWTRRIRTERNGIDMNTQRVWKDIHEEEFCDGPEGEVSIRASSIFQETCQETKRTTVTKRDKDGSQTKETTLETIDEGREIVVQDEWRQNEDGIQWGKKSGNTTEGVWQCVWFKRPNGDTEITEWTTSKGRSKGEKSGRSHNGEVYCERWETSESQQGAEVETRRFIDKWWTGANGHRWGEKSTTTTIVDEKQEGKTKWREVSQEKWYDNHQEKSVDEWTTTETFGDDGRLEHLVECGRVVGDRYTDGTKWGEHWRRVYERTSSVEDGSQTSRSNSPGHGLTLRIRGHDKWWKEPSGNKWGEKRHVDLKLGEERNEDWYNNGVEEQIDRWEINAAGERRGEKIGRSVDGLRVWCEKWSREAEEEADFWIDKYWIEQKEMGQRIKWGEVVGREGGKQWKQKWEERHEGRIDSGHRWVEKWEDDGFGNIHTIKEGEKWIEGRTVDWFCDKYGERLGNQEKWAAKQGRNQGGDEWTEKWTEAPHAKWAEKEGKNRHGDEWRECWNEKRVDHERHTWAEKSGKNARGERWTETWTEQGTGKKTARKIGQNAVEEWEEQWGEDLHPDGSGEKWTSKWAKGRDGAHATGESWGDRWGKDGIGGHHWGEKWSAEQVDKWWRDTSGRPEGC